MHFIHLNDAAALINQHTSRPIPPDQTRGTDTKWSGDHVDHQTIDSQSRRDYQYLTALGQYYHLAAVGLPPDVDPEAKVTTPVEELTAAPVQGSAVPEA